MLSSRRRACRGSACRGRQTQKGKENGRQEKEKKCSVCSAAEENKPKVKKHSREEMKYKTREKLRRDVRNPSE